MASISRTAGTTFSSFNAVWGLCSGTSNAFSSATCANFLGYRFGGVGGNFTAGNIGGATGKNYVSSGGDASLTPDNFNVFVHKHNTTETNVAAAGSAGTSCAIPILTTGATDDDRGIFMLEITKPLGSAGAVGTNYQLNTLVVNGSQNDFFRGRTPSNAMFWKLMNYPTQHSGLTTANYLGVAYSTLSLTNFAVATIDEPTNGALDTFNIHWNAQSATNALRVHQVAIKKLV